ncbi:hypothetical protein [Aeoliella mucimassa]|uniref:Uncharacterized protein n=1 Tax=Aeoliella mucimassa TaxID=2527972 RepID=A0A518AT85_9BACT|nr:hypothetical protein [Aeoliella mucimassa]QDU57916.1 hypothetical protein Pan181_41390 [Aeoliella mucimassa]
MISLGSVLKGPELSGSQIDSAIMAATKAAAELRGEFKFGSSPAVNVVFHVPGSTGSPDWDGLQNTKFSRQQQLLMVVVAVPENIVNSANPEDFVIKSLYGANAVAFEFFRQKDMDFPLVEAEQLVASIKARIT